MTTDVQGLIYLLHFNPPYKHAGHYLGFTTLGSEERLRQHLVGHGSPLVKAAVATGCEVRLVATWPGTRHLERYMKNQGSSTRRCPLCRAKWNATRRLQKQRAKERRAHAENAKRV